MGDFVQMAVDSVQTNSSKGSIIRKNILYTPLTDVTCVLLYIFLLLENAVEQFVPGLNYFDEIIFIGSIMCACLVLWQNNPHLDKRLVAVAGLSFTALIFGLLGNCINSYQNNPIAIVCEMIAFLKFPLTFFAFIVLLRDVDCRNVISGCSSFSKAFLAVAFVCCILNYLSPSFGFGHDVRNGILSFKFIYSHPTFLVFSLVMSFVMLEAKKSGFSFWKMICLFMIAMTMRDKGFGFIALLLFAWVVNISKKKRVLKYFLLGGAVVLVAVAQKITLYMSYTSSPREVLYQVAAQMAGSSFPFGGGLGSIASSLSARYYSDAYYQYGLSNMDGLAPWSYTAAGDAGIPYYIGQFGFVGSACFIAGFVLLCLYVFGLCPRGSSRRGAAILLVGYIVLAITVEAVLTNPSGLISAILLAFIAGGKHWSGESANQGNI